MSHPAGHPLKRVLHDNQRVFSMTVDYLIREIDKVVPFHAMLDYLDWENPPPIWEIERILRCRLENAQFDLEARAEALGLRRTALSDQVRNAFANVELGQGISISQAIVLDDYGGEEEQQKARARDVESHWAQVNVNDKDPGGSALTYMDARGFRFYLPAYLVNHLMYGLYRLKGFNDSNTHGSLVWTLDSKLAAEKGFYDILNQPQKECVAQFLLLVWEVDDDEDALAALKRYWIQYLTQEERLAIS